MNLSLLVFLIHGSIFQVLVASKTDLTPERVTKVFERPHIWKQRLQSNFIPLKRKPNSPWNLDTLLTTLRRLYQQEWEGVGGYRRLCGKVWEGLSSLLLFLSLSSLLSRPSQLCSIIPLLLPSFPSVPEHRHKHRSPPPLPTRERKHCLLVSLPPECWD